MVQSGSLLRDVIKAIGHRVRRSNSLVPGSEHKFTIEDETQRRRVHDGFNRD